MAQRRSAMAKNQCTIRMRKIKFNGNDKAGTAEKAYFKMYLIYGYPELRFSFWLFTLL